MNFTVTNLAKQGPRSTPTDLRPIRGHLYLDGCGEYACVADLGHIWEGEK